EDYASQSGTILYPAVDARLSADRQKLSGVSFGQNGGFIYSLHNASVDVSFAFDPFGSGRRYLESLRANIDYQGFQMEAAYLALTANIVTAAVSEASLRGQLKALRDVVESQQAQLAIIKKQFELGVLTRADVLSQRATLAQTRTGLPPLQKQLAQVQHYLSVLAGRLPGQPGMPEFQLSDLHVPETLPVSLPAELVRQRPDIRAAEAQLHQASALVGLATANQYPSLSITAGFGRQAVQFGDLLSSPATAVWSIGGKILQPLFHGGELTAKRRQALASFDAARAQYRQTVLNAFQNVADVLRALQSDADALDINEQAESLSGQRLKLVQRQFELGAASFLSLLSAQQQFRNIHISVVQARAMLISDTAALFQAMGGGWRQGKDAYRQVAGDADFSAPWSDMKQVGMKQAEDRDGKEQ
ncbi:MAG: efflux transporter outer membrane subunit, partial [Mariprofundus sp.]|nr:efflux transporter outer membrane subunit [Mariprofundus sp.]